MKTTMSKGWLGGALAVVLGAALATPAHAYIDGGSTACGSTSAGWNAPTGASVATRGDGPIRAVMDAIGEYRTHQILSHGTGPGAWASHSTAKTPGARVFGSLDTDDLAYGYPATSQMNMGAAYTAMYSGNNMHAKWQSGGSAGAAVANWLWNSLPSCSSISNGICYYWATSQKNSSHGLWIIGRRNSGSSQTFRHFYSLYQYQNIRDVHLGGANGLSGGNQCSSFMAWAQAFGGHGVIQPRHYNNSQIRAAAQLLYDNVRSSCQSAAGWLGGLFVSCSGAGNQVVNCMAENRCGDTSDRWRTTSQWLTADSISPDRVGGFAGSVHTIWGSAEQNLQWNQAGNVYGCWF
jgi:hypothetical protein